MTPSYVQESLQEEKLSSIIDGVLAAMENLCSCTLPGDSINNAVFSCRNTNKAVVFKAQIRIASETVIADQMLRLISSWAKDSPSIVALRTLLQVDPTCPTEFEMLLADDCQRPTHSAIRLYSTTPSGPDSEGHEMGVVTIIGGAVGGLVTIVVIAVIAIGCVVFCKTKQAKARDHW